MAKENIEKIIIDQFNRGGIADSKWSGVEHSLAKMVGFDIHSTPGLLKVNQALVKESGTLVDEFVKVAIACSDGNSYWFSSTSGKIWKRTGAGVWSLAYTTTPAVGGAGCLGAMEYQGFIYWATESRLHRIAVTGTSDWATNAVEDWATFTNTDSEFHPMVIQNQVLYIGDANYVAQVDGGTFSANALDIKTPLRIKSLGKVLTDILIGTYVNDSINETEILRWNTWSVSFSVSDTIKEPGVNAFILTDNFVLVNAGLSGNLYLYNVDRLELFKRIPGSYSPSSYGSVNPYAVGNLRGLPLFGFSNGSGNPTEQGVYSIGNHPGGYPTVLNLEYPISSGNLSNVEIGAILVLGNDLLVSWKDSTGGASYGVDKLDYSTKYANAYFETRVMTPSREELNNFFKYIANYVSLPTNTGITLKYKKNYQSSWQTDLTMVKDTIKNQVFAESVLTANVFEVRLETTVSGNTAPEIENLEVLLK